MIFEYALYIGLILAGLGALSLIEIVVGVMIYGDSYIRNR